jgi:BirA family biotin operon repressor/biotin-[acetyl-CoA-carboxylase] ligase
MADAFLNANELRAATFIRHVELHDTLGSTNDRAAELARDTTIELPAIVAARHQTAGRGRGQHRWWSADGALTFSLLLEPAALGFGANNWPQLSLATAVAICDALSQELRPTNQRAGASPPPFTSVKTTEASANQRSFPNESPHGLEDEPARSKPPARLGIKWPNDVLIHNRKIAGILLESPAGIAPAKNRLVIGIGINVNNSWRAAPPDAGSGSALCDATGCRHNLQIVLATVIGALTNRINQLRARDPMLIQAWQHLDLIAGQNIVLETDGRRIEGKCVEVAGDGALVIDTAVGRQSYYSGSIRMA